MEADMTETVISSVRASELPAVVREAIHAAPDAEVTVAMREDGAVALYGPDVPPAVDDDSWLGTDYWQEKLAAARNDFKAGRIIHMGDEQDFLAVLNK
jgi:hypothetical protein